MLLHLIAFLAALAGQDPVSPPDQGGAQIPDGMVMSYPDQRGWQRCMEPLGADGTVDSRLTVRCESVRNGVPQSCRLETGQNSPVRHRQAARCLAPLHRFADADGQPANGGPVTIPIRLSVVVTEFH